MQSKDKTLYLNSIDTSGEIKSAEYYFSIWGDAISYVGEENVLQIVTDSMASQVRAGAMIVEAYPCIFWTPCTAHILNLVLRDMGKLSWIGPIVNDGKDIVKFIRTHHFALALFRRFSKVELLKYPETRFAYAFFILQQILKVKNALRQLVVSNEWSQWQLKKRQNKETKARVEGHIIGSMDFWQNVERVMAMSEPIVVMFWLMGMHLAWERFMRTSTR